MNKKILARICPALVLLYSFTGFMESAHALKLEAGDILADFVRVKADTGEQSLLGFGEPDSFFNMVLDSDGTLLVLIDSIGGDGQPAIVRYNLTDGSQQTILLLPDSTSGLPSIFSANLLGIAVAPNGQIFAFNNLFVFKVDPLTGQLTILTTLGQFSGISTIAIDTNGDVLVGDLDTNTLFRVNPVTGSTSQISSGGQLSGISVIAVDADDNYIILNQNGSPTRFVKINRTTGSQSNALSAPSLVDDDFISDLIIDTNGDFIVSIFVTIQQNNQETA